LEQSLALVAAGEQPAIFDAEHTDGDAAIVDQVEHLLIAHAGGETALEISAAQLDGVKAGAAGRIERGRKRRSVDRPHMQRQAPEFVRHCSDTPYDLPLTAACTAMDRPVS